MDKSKKELQPTLKLALEKAAHYCAYQERSQSEVRKKLYDLGLNLNSNEVEEIIMMLIQEDFLNEERFAKAYCKGKFNQNKWGKKKIIQGLKEKKVSDRCIREGLLEIPEDIYIAVLTVLLEKKKATLKDKNQWIVKKKLLNYATQKGYEYDIIQTLL